MARRDTWVDDENAVLRCFEQATIANLGTRNSGPRFQSLRHIFQP